MATATSTSAGGPGEKETTGGKLCSDGGAETVLVTLDLYLSEGEDSEERDAPSTPVEDILASPRPLVILKLVAEFKKRAKQVKRATGKILKKQTNKGNKKQKQRQLEKIR